MDNKLIEKASSVSEVRKAISNIKRNGHKWMTNLYMHDEQLKNIIANGELFIIKSQYNVVLFWQREGIRVVYYFATDVAEMKGILSRIIAQSNEMIMIDVIDKSDIMETVLSQLGFAVYSRLKRMTKIVETPKQFCIPDSYYANLDDAEAIYDILQENLDNQSEQLPSVKDIQDGITDRKILVSRNDENGEVAAVIIFAIRGGCLEFRYWATAEKYKKCKILYGMNVYKIFKKFSDGFKRSFLFVKEGNQVYKINRMNGYKFDGLVDTIYCKSGKGGGVF